MSDDTNDATGQPDWCPHCGMPRSAHLRSCRYEEFTGPVPAPGQPITSAPMTPQQVAVGERLKALAVEVPMTEAEKLPDPDYGLNVATGQPDVLAEAVTILDRHLEWAGDEHQGYDSLIVIAENMAETLRALATRYREAETRADDMTRMGSALYSAIVRALAPHFPAETRDLEWDVLPSTLSALAARANEAKAARDSQRIQIATLNVLVRSHERKQIAAEERADAAEAALRERDGQTCETCRHCEQTCGIRELLVCYERMNLKRHTPTFTCGAWQPKGGAK